MSIDDILGISSQPKSIDDILGVKPETEAKKPKSINEILGIKTDGPIKRGFKQVGSSIDYAKEMTGAAVTGDYSGAAKSIADAARYRQENPSSPEGQELMEAWDEGEGVLGGFKGVAGEMKKDISEAPSKWEAAKATGRNIRAMASGVAEQVPNMILPMAGMVAGAAAGSAALPVIGTAAGAWGGASTGNAVVEGQHIATQSLQEAGIDPTDEVAVAKHLEENAGRLFKEAAAKGSIIGAIDTVTMGLATKLLRRPAQLATRKALADMGVDTADKAAVKAAVNSTEFADRIATDAAYQASKKGIQRAARNAGAAVLEPTGEFAGEYIGSGVAMGDWDEKEAMLEALSSIGQSAAVFAGQKGYERIRKPSESGKVEVGVDAIPEVTPETPPEPSGPVGKAVSSMGEVPEFTEPDSPAPGTDETAQPRYTDSELLELIRSPKKTTRPTDEQRPYFQDLVKRGLARDDGGTFSITEEGKKRLAPDVAPDVAPSVAEVRAEHGEKVAAQVRKAKLNGEEITVEEAKKRAEPPKVSKKQEREELGINRPQQRILDNLRAKGKPSRLLDMKMDAANQKAVNALIQKGLIQRNENGTYEIGGVPDTSAAVERDLMYQFADTAQDVQDQADTRTRANQFNRLQSDTEWQRQEQAAQQYNQQRNAPADLLTPDIGESGESEGSVASQPLATNPVASQEVPDGETQAERKYATQEERDEARRSFERTWQERYGNRTETAPAEIKRKEVEPEPELTLEDAKKFAKMTQAELDEYNASVSKQAQPAPAKSAPIVEEKPTEDAKPAENDGLPEFPVDEARGAYAHTSRNPGNAATVEKGWYENSVNSLREDLLKDIPPGRESEVEQAVAGYAADYIAKRRNVLRSRSNTVSSHIAGRSKFNSKQASRRGNALDRSEEAFTQWDKKAKQEILERLGVAQVRRERSTAKEEAKRKASEEADRRLAEQKKKNAKLPIINSPKGAAPITSEEWSKTHPDYKGIVVNEKDGYRYRSMIIDGALSPVYLTDKKTVEPPVKQQSNKQPEPEQLVTEKQPADTGEQSSKPVSQSAQPRPSVQDEQQSAAEQQPTGVNARVVEITKDDVPESPDTTPASGPSYSTTLGTILTQARKSRGITGQLAQYLSDFIPGSKLDIPVRVDPKASTPSYNARTGVITLRDPQQYHTSLHEIVHAVTVAEMDANLSIKARVRRLMNQVAQSKEVKALVSDEMMAQVRAAKTSQAFKSMYADRATNQVAYAFLNEREFLAQAVSDKQFQAILKKVKVSRGGKLVRAWDAFVDTVLRALGIDATHRDAFGEALGIIAELAQQEAGQVSDAKSDHLSLPWSVGWSDKRIKQEIQIAEYPGGETRSYIAWVDPADFVRATVPSDSAFEKIEIDAGVADLAKMRDEQQTPFLRIREDDLKKKHGLSFLNDNKVIGHEGRHRLMALANAGVARVPVVVDRREPAVIERKDNETVSGQSFGEQGTGSNLKLYNLIPLTSSNFREIKGQMAEYGDDVSFALLSDPDIMEALDDGPYENMEAQTARSFLNRKPRADMNPAEKALSTFEYIARRHQSTWKAFQAQMNRRDTKFMLEEHLTGDVRDKNGKLIAQGFTSFMEETKKKFKSDYEKAKRYLLDTDRTGKGFNTKRGTGWKVTDPDGKFVGYADDEQNAYELAKDHKEKNFPDKTIKDYKYDDKAEWWDVRNPKGETIGTFEKEREADRLMVESETKYLKDKDYSDRATETVMRFRIMTNSAFALMVEDMRRVLREAQELGLQEPTVETLDESKRWVLYDARNRAQGEFSSKEDAEFLKKELEKTYKSGEKLRVGRRGDDEIQKVVTIPEAIAMMGDLKGTYFPRQRESGAVVLRAVHPETGDQIRENFDLYLTESTSVDIDTGVERKRPMSNWLRNKFNQATGFIPFSVTLEKRARQLRKEGYEIIGIDKDTKMPESIFDVAKLTASVDALLQEAKSKSKKDMQGEHEKIALELNKMLTAGVADIFKQRGYLSSRMKRSQSYWRGFEEDPLIAGVQYAKGLSGGIAKRDAAQKMVAALTGREKSFTAWKQENEDGTYEEYMAYVDENRLDPKEQPRLYAETMSWMSEVLRNDEQVDRIMGTIKGLAVIKFLGLRVASAAVNMTNMLQAVPATIASESGASLTASLRSVGSAATKYGIYRTGKGTMTDADRAIFAEISERGWDEAQFNHENASVLQSKLGRQWSKVADGAMWLFGAAEKANRAMTIFAAYKQLRANTSLEHGAAMEKAKFISDRAHGIYGKATIPAWARGQYNPLKLSYTFQKFMHNYLLNMWAMGGKGNYKEAAYLLASPAFLAGAGASLITPVVSALASALGAGDDPEEDFYQWAEDTFGTDRILRHGLAGAFGVNLKGSLQMHSPMPRNLAELFGAPQAIYTDTAKAIEYYSKGQVYKGSEALLPTAIGSLFKAVREGTEGITTGSYGQVFYGNEALKSTTLEQVARALSFNPSRISGIREKQWRERLVARKYQEEKAEITEKLKRYYIFGKGDFAKLRKEWSDYNEKVIGTGRPELRSYLLTPRGVRQAVKNAQRPNKRERMR